MKQSQQQSQHQQNQGLGNSQGNPVGNNNMDIEEKNDGQNTHYPGHGQGF